MDIQTASHLNKGKTVNETHTCPDISWDGCSVGRTNLTKPVETLRIYHAYNWWNIHMQHAWNCKNIGSPRRFVKLICTCVFAFLISSQQQASQKKTTSHHHPFSNDQELPAAPVLMKCIKTIKLSGFCTVYLRIRDIPIWSRLKPNQNRLKTPRVQGFQDRWFSKVKHECLRVVSKLWCKL